MDGHVTFLLLSPLSFLLSFSLQASFYGTDIPGVVETEALV